MTVHAIRGFVAPDSGMSDSDVQKVIDDWVSKRVKWEIDWDANVTRRNTEEDESGEDYLWFGVAFTWDSADKDNTLQKCADKFKQKVDWFRAVYHVCGNDREDLSAEYDCSWDERWNWEGKNVTVPPEIEGRVPDAETVVNA